MKVPEFRYVCPITLDDALACLASDEHDYKPQAGGQSMMPMMKLRLAGLEIIVDFNKSAERVFICEEASRICSGAMVRYAALHESAIVRQHILLFGRALRHIAQEAIHSRGTIGGSVAHRRQLKKPNAWKIFIKSECDCYIE